MQNITAESYKISALQATKNPTPSSKNDIDKFLGALESKEFKDALLHYLKEHQKEPILFSLDKIMETVTKAFREYQKDGHTSQVTLAELKVTLEGGKIEDFLRDVKAVAENFPETQKCQEALEEFEKFIQQLPIPVQKANEQPNPWTVG